MNKKIFLSTIAFSILIAANINAEDVIIEPIIVITATKTERSIDGIAASVEVLTQKDIEKIGGESLSDLVDRMPGVHMQHSGGAGSSGQPKSAISIRGINAKGTLTLIDGRRIATEFKKAYELRRIPASQIERIEVIKGPMSTLYGSDASGGVVNIITKKPKDGKTEIDFGVRYGQNSDDDAQNRNINLTLKSNVGKLKYSTYINHTNTDPYIQKENSNIFIVAKKKSDIKKPSQNPKTKGKVPDIYENEDITFRDDSEILTYGARVDYAITSSTTIGAEFNAFDEQRTGTYLAAYSKSQYKNNKNKPITLANVPINSKEDNQRLDLGLDIVSYINNNLRLTLRGYRSKYEKLSTSTSAKWEDLGFSNEASTYRKKMEVESVFYTIEGIANYALNDNHLLTAGIENRNENWDSFVFPGGNRKAEYKSAYLQDEWEIVESLNAIIGLRYDDISNAENKTTFKLGIIKKFLTLLNLRVNFAQGYRAPDIKELYVDRITTKGTQKGAAVVDASIGKISYNLKPEFTNAYEIGLSGRNNKFSYSLALFLNQIDNQIASVKTDKYYTYVNISEAETKGFEISASYKLLENLSSGFSWTELKTEDKTTGNDLEFQPERVVSLNLDYQVNDNLIFGAIVKYTGEQYFQETLNIGAPNQSKKDSIVDGYTFFDLTAAYDINKNFTVYGGIDNILDEDVDDAIGSTVGRFFYAGMRVHF